ncbi:hypothetical protein ACTXGQ_08650 [Marinobacter sp. 1Y8]
MLRSLVAVLFIALVVGAAVLGSRWLAQNSNNEASALKTCHLGQQDCRWAANGSDWQMSLSRKPDSRKMTLKVTTSAAPERLLAVLSGESMYMGQYPVPLTKTSVDTYHAEFNPPICTTGSDMRWKISMKANGEDVNSDSLVPVFEARHGIEPAS